MTTSYEAGDIIELQGKRYVVARTTKDPMKRCDCCSYYKPNRGTFPCTNGYFICHRAIPSDCYFKELNGGV